MASIKSQYKKLSFSVRTGLFFLLSALFVTAFSSQSYAAKQMLSDEADGAKTAPPSGPVIMQLVDKQTSQSLVRPHVVTDANIVAGDVMDANNIPTAAYYEEGTITSLGTLGGATSNAYDINESLIAVGQSRLPGAPTLVAYYWMNGQMTQLSPESSISSAYGINDLGVAAGYWVNDDYDARAMVWDVIGGTQIELGTLGGNASIAYDINEYGVVVGLSSLSDNNVSQRAFVYKDGQMTNLDPTGTLDSRAIAVNDLGVVVGRRGNISFIWSEIGGLRDINMNDIYDINNNGLVVGEVDVSGVPFPETEAAVWVGNQIIILNDWLNDPNWDLETATAVNDQNYVVGTGTYNGVETGYILRFSLNGPGNRDSSQYDDLFI